MEVRCIRYLCQPPFPITSAILATAVHHHATELFLKLALPKKNVKPVSSVGRKCNIYLTQIISLVDPGPWKFPGDVD